MPRLDPYILRQEFPALSRVQGDRPVVYLDGPGGTQVPQRVIDAVSAYYRESNANDGGAFATSAASDAIVAKAHSAVADLLGASGPDEVKFGYNMSTLTFHISRAICAGFAVGDEIVVTGLDHEANVSPWQAIAADRGLVVRTVDVRLDDCTLDLADLESKLTARTRLVAVGYASNAVGTINPVTRIVELAHAAGAVAYVDAVHYVPHLLVDVRAIGTDFLVTSAYKWFGPHLGALYGRREVLESVQAYKVRPAHDWFETGTPNFEGIAGTLAAVDYLRSVGRRFGDPTDGTPRSELEAAFSAIADHERQIGRRMLEGLAAIPGVRVWGIADPGRIAERTPTVSITIDGIHPRAAAEALGAAGIFAWDGDFYAQGLIERLGLHETGGLIRLGLVHYTTADEVDRVLEAVETIAIRAPQPPAGRSDR